MEIAIGMSMVRNGSFQMVNELTETMAMECWLVQLVSYGYGMLVGATGFLWLADSLTLHVHVVILEDSNVGRTQHSSMEPSLMMHGMDQGVACLI